MERTASSILNKVVRFLYLKYRCFFSPDLIFHLLTEKLIYSIHLIVIYLPYAIVVKIKTLKIFISLRYYFTVVNK